MRHTGNINVHRDQNCIFADGYDIVRSYTEGMQIQEKKENKKRGVMALYALPDTRKLGLTEAQAYAVVWDTFRRFRNRLREWKFIMDRIPVKNVRKDSMR